MKKILIIGIGAGNPEYVTIQAVNALNRVDVFFILDKGIEKQKLTDLRREICQRYIQHENYRFAEVTLPERDRKAPNYPDAVADLNAGKQKIFEQLIDNELNDGQCGAFLVWGDPSLYDSTIRIVEAIARSGRYELDYEVIPGITSVQALAAQHRVALNTIGESIAITTGRKLSEGFPNNIDSLVVMLDAQNAYKYVDGRDLDIYWGAYLGTPDEVLVAGKLSEVMNDIERIRETERQKSGWIMDTYLLRKNPPAST